MTFAKILLALSVGSNITTTVIYLYYIFKNKIRPHSFTFLIWSIVLGINLVAQVLSGVGWGTLLLASNLLACVIIFLTCFKKGYRDYDKKDISCLVLGVLAIIIWAVTKQPLYSVILSCVIDLFAFIPSFRKSFRKPNEDSAVSYYISSLEYIFSLPSYQTFTLLALLYPVWIAIIDFSYASWIIIRRARLSNSL